MAINIQRIINKQRNSEMSAGCVRIIIVRGMRKTVNMDIVKDNM